MTSLLSGLLILLIIIILVNCMCNYPMKHEKMMMYKKEEPECGSNQPQLSMMTASPVEQEYKPVEGYEDYDNYLLNVGVDEEVVKSHKQFSDEINKNSTGSSSQTILSGDVFDNPWVGLRRPSTNVKVSDDARMVPSAYQEQYPTTSRYYKCGDSLF